MRTTTVPLDVRIALMRQYGCFTLAYSATFQPGLQHFGDQRGFLAYKTIWGKALVLGDPIAPADSCDKLVERFLAQYPNTTFWQISRPLAAKLSSQGFSVNELGLEWRLDLNGLDFSGQARRNIRKATSRIERLGYRMAECQLSEVDLDEVKAVSQAWRRGRMFRWRTVGFLNRPLILEEEPDARRFFMFDRQERMLAFCVCDPLYKAGAIIGYSTSNARFRPGSDAMINQALKRHIAETLQQEGKRWLSFGLAPADGIEDKDFQRDWLIRRALRFGYTNTLFNSLIYSMHGHAMHKRQFGGEATQTYVALQKQSTRSSLLDLIRMLRASGLV